MKKDTIINSLLSLVMGYISVMAILGGNSVVAVLVTIISVFVVLALWAGKANNHENNENQP